MLGTDPATTLETYLPPIRTEELLTREEFAEFKDEIRQFRSEVNQRFDRVLLALVGGMFVMLAAILGTVTFS